MGVSKFDRATNVVVGQCLREVREDLGLSLEAVELRSRGVHKGNKVASWERGERTPTVSDLISLCAVYPVSVEHLVEVIERRAQAS